MNFSRIKGPIRGLFGGPTQSSGGREPGQAETGAQSGLEGASFAGCEPVRLEAPPLKEEIPTSQVRVELINGPVKSFEGTVVLLDSSRLYGVFGDMTKVPRIPLQETILLEGHEVEVYGRKAGGNSPGKESSLMFVVNEDWKREPARQVGDRRAVYEALQIASGLNSTVVVIAAPNCCSQYYFREVWAPRPGESEAPAPLMPEELEEIGNMMLGVQDFLKHNSATSVQRIIVLSAQGYECEGEGIRSAAREHLADHLKP